MKLLIQFKGIENLHPDDAEVVDADLIGTGTNKKAYHLTYDGQLDEFTVYQFGSETTVSTVQDMIFSIKHTFPSLEIIYKYL